MKTFRELKKGDIMYAVEIHPLSKIKPPIKLRKAPIYAVYTNYVKTFDLENGMSFSIPNDCVDDYSYTINDWRGKYVVIPDDIDCVPKRIRKIALKELKDYYSDVINESNLRIEKAKKQAEKTIKTNEEKIQDYENKIRKLQFIEDDIESDYNRLA